MKRGKNLSVKTLIKIKRSFKVNQSNIKTENNYSPHTFFSSCTKQVHGFSFANIKYIALRNMLKQLLSDKLVYDCT